jgi:MFS superfamily sulfate permease-like transporter
MMYENMLIYLCRFALSSEVPALYPTVDLFLAPFLANLALIVDQTLADDVNVAKSENDTIFLATFGVLSAIGICFSGLLLGLASAFKLANLGSFLPFPVICGFFAAVGVLTWTLAFTVDTGGKSIGTIIFSGDMELVADALMHHIPSVVIAAAMKYLGPKNPFYVIVVSVVSIGLFYAIMFAMGLSLEEAKEQGWFWTHQELVYQAAEVVPVCFIFSSLVLSFTWPYSRLTSLSATYVRSDLTRGLHLLHLVCYMR